MIMKTPRPQSKNRVLLNVKVIDKLREIARIENDFPENIIEKLIMNYVPVPAVPKEGEFKSIAMNRIHTLRKISPYCCVVSVLPNSKIGLSWKEYLQYKTGKISWLEFKRMYIERLMKPDATQEINRLREIKKSRDIYITSMDYEEETSMRKIFVDFVNGRITWT